MLTPNEIRQQNFTRELRGYNRVEVDAFLHEVSQALEQQIESNRALNSEIEKLKASYHTLKEVENMLHKTLMQAEHSSRATMENARQKAELKVREAESRAREVVQKGIEERKRLERDIESLTKRKEEVLTQLQVFLQSQLGRLDTFQHKALPFTPMQMLEEPEVVQEDNLFGAQEVKNGINGAEHTHEVDYANGNGHGTSHDHNFFDEIVNDL